jgi:hypothetical protein
MFDEELAGIPAQPPRKHLLPGLRLRAAIPREMLGLMLIFLIVATFVPLSIFLSDMQMSLDQGPSRHGGPPAAIFLTFPLFVITLFAPIFLPQIRALMRARRLFRKGILTTGRVVFVKKRNIGTWPGWPGSSLSDIYITYQHPRHDRIECVAACTNDWLTSQLSPGSTVHIAVDLDEPTRATLLEAYLR